jgi:ABC-2 type transport system ATP-binding protein
LYILQASDIIKKYSGHTALNKVSINISENSIFGLLGPNGAGKTSFIRIINQIIAPDSGEVKFKGERLSPNHISSIGYLPEERGLYKKMEVGEHLIYLSRLKGISLKDSKAKLRGWLERMDLTAWEKNKIEDLSKGMQQKVQFIAAVLHEPKLIILDEPFSGFDPINAEIIKSEILALKKRGATIVLSTHRMESVEELCSEIVLLNKSEKILEGTVSEIKQRFKKDVYVVEGNGEISETTVIKIASKELLLDGKVRIKISAVKNYSSNEVLKEIMKEMEVSSFKEEVPSIHDIFIQEVKGAHE